MLENRKGSSKLGKGCCKTILPLKILSAKTNRSEQQNVAYKEKKIQSPNNCKITRESSKSEQVIQKQEKDV